MPITYNIMDNASSSLPAAPSQTPSPHANHAVWINFSIGAVSNVIAAVSLYIVWARGRRRRERDER